MTPAELESTYELLATHIDRFDETIAPVYLAKVALLMASELNELETVNRCITAAAEGLDER